MLEKLFTSKSRSEVFRVLFSSPETSFYLRELERITSVSKTSLEKELKYLLSIDLISSKKDGNRVYYKANRSHPIYPELLSIVEKTSGVRATLKRLMQDDRVAIALLFGSFVNGAENSKSDVDLVIVGTIGLRQFSKLISGVQESIGREINPHIYSLDDFRSKLKNEDHFLTSVLSEKFEILKGDLFDYR